MDWLELLDAELPEGSPPRHRLDRDLRAGLAPIGIDPRRGFMLVPYDEAFVVERDGRVSTVRALLVGPDAHGEAVTAWDAERALLAAPAGRFTVNRSTNDLKSQGIPVARGRPRPCSSTSRTPS